MTVRGFVVCSLACISCSKIEKKNQAQVEQPAEAEAELPMGFTSWSPLDASYPGISRTSYRTTGNTGNSYSVNAIRVDLSTPGIRLATTKPLSPWMDGIQETITTKVSLFISSSQKTSEKFAVAINTDAFDLTSASQSVPTNLIGYAVSNGTLVSSGSSGGVAATLFWDPVNGAKMENTSKTSTNTATVIANQVAVSGFSFALQNGVVKVYDATLAARSGAGLSQDNRYLFLVAVDRRVGRNSSDGCTIGQLGEQLLALGAFMGINLDGGGSTQMAWWNPLKATVQMLGGSDTRYVGQHLGIYYLK
jgi:hypothetical protein